MPEKAPAPHAPIKKRRIAKIIILSVLGVILGVAAYKIIYFELFKTCGNCGPSNNQNVFNNEALALLNSNDFRGCVLVFSSSNGSLPPPYHRERVLTVSENAAGKITATYETRDYTKTLEAGDLTVTASRFTDLMRAGLVIGPDDSEELAGCTGGTSKSLTISRNGTAVMETSSYNCAGRTSNSGLDEFADSLEDILPDD